MSVIPIELAALDRAVKMASIALGKTDKDPVVKTLWLNIIPGSIEVVATDKAVISYAKAQTAYQGSALELLVSGEKFLKVISELDAGGDVMLDVNTDSNCMEIRSSRTMITLGIEPPKDFPKGIFLGAKEESTVLGEISLNEILSGLKFVKPFSGGERAQAHGMIIQMRNSRLIAGSTSIGVFESPAFGEISFKLFASNAASLIKYLSDIRGDRVMVIQSGDFCYFKSLGEEDNYFGFHLEQLEFPSIDRYLADTDAFCNIITDKVFAERVVRRISIPLLPDGNRLDLTVSKSETDGASSLQVSSTDDKGRISSEAYQVKRLDVRDEEKFAVNFERVLSALAQFQGPVINFRASEKLKMIIMEETAETFKAVAIIPLLLAKN